MVTLLSDAMTLGEMSFYGDVRQPKAPSLRRCPCGTVLSRYQAADRCFPCQERMREREQSIPHVQEMPHGPRRGNTEERVEERELVLDVLRSEPAGMLTRDIALETGLSSYVIKEHLLYAEKHAIVRRVGKRGCGASTVAVWGMRE